MNVECKMENVERAETAGYPEDWNVYTLGQIGEPLMCKRVFKEQTDVAGDVPFFKIGTFGGTPDAFISRTLYEEFKIKFSYPKKGDILISAAGTIGRLVVFDGKDAYFQDSNIVWLDNDETVVSNNYLYWAFQNMKWQTEDGGIVSRLYNSNLKAMKLLLPPLPEQKRIAAALGDMDKLLDNLSKRIEKKKAVKQGAMQELLTGKKRLPGFSGEWNMLPFGECFEFHKNNTLAREFLSDMDGKVGNIHYGDVLIRYGSVLNVESTCIPHVSPLAENKYPRDFIKDGDVIIADTAEDETAGKVVEICGVNDMKIVSGLHTVFCRPKDGMFSSGWLGYVMNSSVYHEQLIPFMTGIKVLSLSKASFMKTSIPHPSLAEQKAIANVLGDMDAEISKLEAKRAKLADIKKGMMGDLLTGKVRLKGK